MSFCKSCFKKTRTIFRLRAEIALLNRKLRYEEQRTKEGYFGSSTPSAQKPIKPNTHPATELPKNGGAVKGHPGHGRTTVAAADADRIETLFLTDCCPDCGGQLDHKGIVERTVVECEPIKTKRILYRREKKWCRRCRKTITAKPKVLPKFLYGNQLIAQTAVMHYGHGVPVGRVEQIIGTEHLSSGSLFDVFNRVARFWQSALDPLIIDLRREKVIHADETGWRTDGRSGYAWIFCSQRISLFQFKDTRSARIPRMIFGLKKLSGFLVVDRYAAYNKLPIRLQYCYAHLLRHVEDLEKEFSQEPEVHNFVTAFAPLLADAIRLRTLPISDRIYYARARRLQQKILAIVDAPARHLGIKAIQLVFKLNKKRLYHWVFDRAVPADNNSAERELRPTVIARKVSFGSQSTQGANTRSVMMTILHTARKRLQGQSLSDWFKNALDRMAENPLIDPYSLLPPP